MGRFLAVIAMLCLAGAAKAETWLAGDSLCDGVRVVSGLPSVARVGALTREVQFQLRRVPNGARVIVCAGTNDAAGSLYGFHRDVLFALDEAKARAQTMIWVGPPQVSKSWDAQSDKADTLLALTVPKYVSLRAVRWERGERAGDGVHFTPRGYGRIYSLARAK